MTEQSDISTCSLFDQALNAYSSHYPIKPDMVEKARADFYASEPARKKHEIRKAARLIKTSHAAMMKRRKICKRLFIKAPIYISFLPAYPILFYLGGNLLFAAYAVPIFMMMHKINTREKANESLYSGLIDKLTGKYDSQYKKYRKSKEKSTPPPSTRLTASKELFWIEVVH